MAKYDALELKMVDGSYEYVRIGHGATIETELDRFVNQTHAYGGDWIRVGEDRYVRYDRIAEVAAKRGLDDERPPLVM